MSPEEKLDLLMKERKAIESDDMSEVYKIRAMIPIDPDLADSIRKIYGMKHLRETGYDLTEAEVVYGTEWSKIRND